MLGLTDPVERLRLDPEAVKFLAEKWGTPLYVVSEPHFVERINRIQRALAQSWPATEVSFASKANPTPAVMAIAARHGLNVDVASEGEFRAALFAGVPAGRCHFHGNNKSVSELLFACREGIGAIIVDNFEEIDALTGLRLQGETIPDILLRLAPGVDPITHQKISTGQSDTKFGFNLADGAAASALERCLDAGMKVVGVHAHVGSQLQDNAAFVASAEALGAFVCTQQQRLQWHCEVLNVGGGMGVAYTSRDMPEPIENVVSRVALALRAVLPSSRLPRLAMEPGRSLIAESGVTIYRVGVVKTVPIGQNAHRTYVSVDGGLSDNPRPALYDAEYPVECIPLEQRSVEFPEAVVTISGKHCETDTLFREVKLPTMPKRGDWIQVLCTGAYNAAMASNYNRYPRPAQILLRMNGEVEVIQRRETWEDLLSRDIVPGDLN